MVQDGGTVKQRKIMAPMNAKQTLIALMDLSAILVAGPAAMLAACNFTFIVEYHYSFLCNYFLIAMIMLSINGLCGTYKSLWRYAGLTEALRLIMASCLTFMLLEAALKLSDLAYPTAFPFVFTLLTMMAFMGIRFSYRIVRKMAYYRQQAIKGSRGAKCKRVMILGAGQAGSFICKQLMEHREEHRLPVVFLDDDPTKRGRSIHGVPIRGSVTSLTEVCRAMAIDEIIIAMPSVSRKRIAEIIETAKAIGCTVRITPSLEEILNGQYRLDQVRDIEIRDLLGRKEIRTDLSSISSYITGSTVMVTGGGGSIGSELCRQLAAFKPAQLVLIDIYENNVYDIQNELLRRYPELKLHIRIASIRDMNRLEDLFRTFSPDVVFHAAAHKHVPLMEDSPVEAVKNNVLGTWNVAQMAHVFGVKRFVMISTDKAVNPTNVMGATKRLAEKVVVAFNSISKTEFVAVRFGNVLGSNGSVIPLFKKQIAEGGPVTVTDPEVIRYFMTIPEAAQLVIQAGAMAKGGEVFVLDMGEPVKILNLAEDLIRLSGFTPYTDIDIKFTGLRPGEKLYEELLTAEEGLSRTAHEKIFIGQQTKESFTLLSSELKLLRRIADAEHSETMLMQLSKLVPIGAKSEESVKENVG